jgi:predicted porin
MLIDEAIRLVTRQEPSHDNPQPSFEAVFFDADYFFNQRFDAYVGAMYSGVHDGVASGYLSTTNINPTVGVRHKF